MDLSSFFFLINFYFKQKRHPINYEVPFKKNKILFTNHANLVLDGYHDDIFHHYLEPDQDKHSYFSRN